VITNCGALLTGAALILRSTDGALLTALYRRALYWPALHWPCALLTALYWRPHCPMHLKNVTTVLCEVQISGIRELFFPQKWIRVLRISFMGSYKSQRWFIVEYSLFGFHKAVWRHLWGVMNNFVNTCGVLRRTSSVFCSPKLSTLVDFSPNYS